MRPKFLTLLLILALSSCAEKPEVVRFWEVNSIDYSNIEAAENQFADFAEMAVDAPEKDAFRAIDVLYDKLKDDEVAYYIYSDWMESAFYNILSPCHSPALFRKAVDRIVKDGIIPAGTHDPFVKKSEWSGYNLPGSVATVPGVVIRERSVVLVLDQGCSSCRQALESMKVKWPDPMRRIAVCCGYGPVPEVEGWEYVKADPSAPVFDPRMTPIYFIVAQDGTVEVSYATVL